MKMNRLLILGLVAVMSSFAACKCAKTPEPVAAQEEAKEEVEAPVAGDAAANDEVAGGEADEEAAPEEVAVEAAPVEAAENH